MDHNQDDPALSRQEADSALAALFDLGDDKLLTSREAAAVLRMSEAGLQARRRDGRVPRFVRMSRTRVFYRVGDIRDAIRALVRTSTSDTGPAPHQPFGTGDA